MGDLACFCFPFPLFLNNMFAKNKKEKKREKCFQCLYLSHKTFSVSFSFYIFFIEKSNSKHSVKAWFLCCYVPNLGLYLQFTALLQLKWCLASELTYKVLWYIYIYILSKCSKYLKISSWTCIIYECAWMIQYRRM